jgi:exopolyphosphatase
MIIGINQDYAVWTTLDNQATHGLKMGGKALDVDRELSDNQQITHHPSVQSLSATLGEKKSSASHLSTRDLLRRDYKEYVFSMPVSEDATQSSNVIKVGLATVPLRLSAFFASSRYPIEEIQDWLADRDLSVLGIITTFRNQKGKGRREQFWMVKAEKGIAKKVWQGLESSEDAEEVTSDEARFGGPYVARAYKQGNASATRKQTAPILRRLVEGL